MLGDVAKVPLALGFEILIGSAMLLSASALGWAIGRRRSWPVVRAIWWWMHAIVLPVLTCRTWGQRSLIIFGNNCLVLATVVAAGAWTISASLAIAAVGIALGIALRSLSELSPHWSSPSPNCGREIRRQIRLGVALNLLEPPAIAIAIGLSLGRSTAQLTPLEVWGAFCLWVVPLLFTAACGEAHWLGAGLQRNLSPEKNERQSSSTFGEVPRTV